MALIDDVKLALRVTGSTYDTEIAALMAAAEGRLRRGGVAVETVSAEADPLLTQAIAMYCKAFFGLDNPDSEKYAAAFESMMAVLALTEDEDAVS